METGVGSTPPTERASIEVPSTEVPSTEVKVRPLDDRTPSVARHQRAGRGIVTVLVAVGALIVGLLVGSGARDGDAPVPLTKLGLAAEERGLATAIEGLEDTLLAVATNGSRAMDIVIWPPRGTLSLRPAPIAWSAVSIEGLPFEDFAAFDASGRYVALAAPVASESSAVLMAGRLEEQVVVATGVTGYAWHLTEPHQLAVAIEDEGITTIHVMLGAPMSLTAVAELREDAQLLAWLERGFLVRDQQSSIGWLSTDGSSGPSVGVLGYLGASADIVLTLDDLGRVLVGDAHTSGEPSVTELLRFDGRTASVEPETGRIAIGGPHGMLVVTADGERITELEHPFVERLDWSSDGRFIVFADRVDVFVLDLETGEITATGLGPSEAVMFRPPAG